MIIDIDIDIVDIHDLETSLHEEGFQRKVFTTAELDSVARYRSKTEHLAGKFAAKEAFMKAIGAGIRQEVWFTHIEVLNNDPGKPHVIVNGEAEKQLAESGAKQVHVGISHSAGTAVAVVILEG
jgi:holo-[acyl-carrier protein] synthase